MTCSHRRRPSGQDGGADQGLVAPVPHKPPLPACCPPFRSGRLLLIRSHHSLAQCAKLMGLGGNSDAPTLGMWGKGTGSGLLRVCEQSPEIGATGYTGAASESAPSEGQTEPWLGNALV